MLLSLLYMALRVILRLAPQGEARDREVEILVLRPTFFNALFDGTLISKDVLGQMTSGEPLSGGHDPVVGYGLGLTAYAPAEYDPADPDLTFYGHGGGLPGFITLVWHEPESGATLVLMSTDARIDLLPAALVMARYVDNQAR